MIKSISYFFKPDKRKHVPCVKGKFTLTKSGKGFKFRSKTFTAVDFIKYVRNRDPYITLKDGKKYRVFRDGDPDHEIVEVMCMIESHDEKEKKKKTIIPDYFDGLGF
tara:strand:+ start:33 stop:353 length:321 start_codon:yes stop_codon:yes gene_type:complete